MRRVVLLCTGLALASCGGSTADRGAPAAETRSTPTLRCPAGTKRFHTDVLIGRAIGPAGRLAKVHGCDVREAKIDGEDQVLTADYTGRRIDVTTSDGTITAIIKIS